STTMVWPVMKLDTSVPRNHAVSPMSAGVPTRPIGHSAAHPARSASGPGDSSITFWFSGVSMTPGAIALQRMPRSAYSAATCCVSDTTAPLLAAYAGCLTNPRKACTDAMLTIAPGVPAASMVRQAAAVPQNGPAMLIPQMNSTASFVASWIDSGWETPALFTQVRSTPCEAA